MGCLTASRCNVLTPYKRSPRPAPPSRATMLDQRKKIVGAVFRTLEEGQRMEVWVGRADESEGLRMELFAVRGKPYVKNWLAPGLKCCLLKEGGVDKWWERISRQWGMHGSFGLRTVSVGETIAWERSWN